MKFRNNTDEDKAYRTFDAVGNSWNWQYVKVGETVELPDDYGKALKLTRIDGVVGTVADKVTETVKSKKK